MDKLIIKDEKENKNQYIQ